MVNPAEIQERKDSRQSGQPKQFVKSAEVTFVTKKLVNWKDGKVAIKSINIQPLLRYLIAIFLMDLTFLKVS